MRRAFRIGLVVLALAVVLAGVEAGLAQETGQATHVVQPGENLLRIALRYGVTVSAIMDANNLGSASLIYVGQALVIPPSEGPLAASAADAPAGTAESVTHTIARGETLISVARQYGVTVNAIMEANGLANPNRITAGQELTIPGVAPSPGPAPAAADTTAAPSGSGLTHTVRSGETLGSIAQQYGVAVGAIMEANGITNPDRLSTGQALTIPGAAGPAMQQRVYLNVPTIKQSRNLSCESASACSLLRYMGYPCTDDMYVFNALPRSYDNPHRGFVGSVDSPAGSLPPGAGSGQGSAYGIYVEALNEGLRAMGVRSNYTYNASLDTLRALLAQGVPVFITATHGMGAYGEQPISYVPTDGDGRAITVIRYQHSYVLVGYDTAGFWAIDPWSGGIDYFANTRLEADWARLGRQALWLVPS